MKFDEIGYNFAVHEELGFVEVNTDGRIVAWGKIRCILEENKTKGTVYTLKEYIDITQVTALSN